MTVPISSIAAIAPVSAIAPSAGAGAAAVTSGTDFAAALSNGFDAVNGAQSNASSLAVQAATGTLTDPAQYTIAATQATLMTQLATTVQSKAVTAFNTIMGMQA
jgi:flagellar hook-basal body complex protein FliE